MDDQPKTTMATDKWNTAIDKRKKFNQVEDNDMMLLNTKAKTFPSAFP